MNDNHSEAPAYLPLFEINLIKEYAERLRRRKRMARVGVAVATIIFIISAVFIFWAGKSLKGIQAMRKRIDFLGQDIAESEALYKKLDDVRTETANKTAEFNCLLPLSQRRVAWASKLAALGNALPDGMSINKIEGESGDLFNKLYDEPGDKKKEEKKKEEKVLIQRSLSFTLIYLPQGGGGDPSRLLLDLLEELRSSEAFMNKMDDVQFEGTKSSKWDKEPVILYEGTLTGATEEP